MKIMKKNLFVVALMVSLSFASCRSQYSFQQFYNSHKNDMNTTAFQLPRFMTAILSGMSPEMNRLFSNVVDFRFISLTQVSNLRQEGINRQINLVTDESFTDVLRQNKEQSRLVISVREHGGIVQELVYYKLENKTIYTFYLKGNFDSNRIKGLIKNNELNDFTARFLKQAQSSNRIVPISIQ
ncbi:MAG: hypothetical protein COB98_07940 [Flavobacteriaceae bacterium]|nr:MAG: hypothetical protein COB98_07940 [Flavobacteriaceae bacterium]